MAEKKRVTNVQILTKITELTVAVGGHPDIPDDGGIVGDVKHIRTKVEHQGERIVETELAISNIVTRCEERHGLNATVARAISKKKLAGGGGSVIAILTLIYYAGQGIGWW